MLPAFALLFPYRLLCFGKIRAREHIGKVSEAVDCLLCLFSFASLFLLFPTVPIFLSLARDGHKMAKNTVPEERAEEYGPLFYACLTIERKTDEKGTTS